MNNNMKSSFSVNASESSLVANGHVKFDAQLDAHDVHQAGGEYLIYIKVYFTSSRAVFTTAGKYDRQLGLGPVGNYTADMYYWKNNKEEFIANSVTFEVV